MSCYVTFGGYRNRKRLARSVIEWFLHHRKLNRFHTFVHVIDRNLKREDMYGCIHSIDQLSRPRFFEIEMCNQQDDESYVTTLCHELTHLEQRLRGKWKQQWKKDKVQNKWHSSVVPRETKYMDEPWEIEAHALEKHYYTKYKENMNGR